MYIPSFNKFENPQEVLAFMQHYSFATIITVMDGVPVATHLPFIVKYEDGKVMLRSHFAKANPQAKGSINQKVLVIFTEPHAYVSPKHYEQFESVPTWNYLAVHAYGQCVLIDGEEKKTALIAETIGYYDAGYAGQWDQLSPKFKHGMLNGIVGFEIEVTDLQAKAKLSQNKTAHEQQSIIAELDRSANTNEKELADYMKRLPAL
jgi:transcriptional regulator